MDTVGQVIRMDNLREGYVAVCKTVANYGEKVAPRGQATRELQCATLIVENPFDTLPSGVGRGIVNGIAAVESAQLLAGESRSKLVTAVGPMFANYREDDGEFWGAYGRRTGAFEQFKMVERRLKADPDSRQTVVTIWDPEYDTQDAKKDYPCTVMYHFMLRGGRLHMEVVMRSNDVWLGLAYDGFQHSRVQIAMASVLGVDVGEYRHHVMSLHVYDRNLDDIEKLTMPQKKPSIFPAIMGATWDDVQWKASLILDAAEDGDTVSDVMGDDEQWYVNSMRQAIEKNRSR